MITGYNTDVRHSDAVFHVQTEDKGTANPFIESLVYVGGRVLAARRASYAKLLAEGKGQDAIVALMDHQHRLMIAAIRCGKFDDKLAALLDGQPVDAVANAEEALTEPAAAPGSGPAPADGDTDRTLDQVILDYLASEAEQDQLVLRMDGNRGLALNRQAELTVTTTSSRSGRPVLAQVSVRMISTVAEPRVLAVGQTGQDGTLDLSFAIPGLDRGTAALIITATSAIGTAEMKHLL